MPEGVPGYLRIRVVKTFNAGNAEITNDLPHLHQTTLRVDAMQPGNPGSSALGSFTIRLHPPGSEAYAAAKPIYDQLDRFQRVEFYVSGDGASLGKLKWAGIIREVVKAYGVNNSFELRGDGDVTLANLSRPFPGELLANDVTSAILKNYLGTNELGAADTFNPFVAGNYTSTQLPAGSAGSWSATTDDGFNVVSNASGNSAVLLSKTGAAANDRWNTQFVEITGRLKPSSDASNAGSVGVGIASANNSTNTSVVGYVTAYKQGGRYSLNANLLSNSGGVANASQGFSSVLGGVDDTQGFIPFTLGLLVTVNNETANVSLIVNGKVVAIFWTTVYNPGTTTNYPFIQYSIPSSGTATIYVAQLTQFTRFTTDGASTASTFGNGSITTSAHSLPFSIDPGPSFLETWTRLATREGWYWRYTPQAYAVGTRTLGTVDFGSDPGTDRSLGQSSNAQCVFSRADGSLVDLQITANQDPLVADTAVIGQPTIDGGGIAFWRDVSSLQKYGVVQDEALAFAHGDFNSQRRAAYQIVQNKITVGNSGAKVATIRRTPETADVWRELDKITIHDPEMGINYFTSRVLGYEFAEGAESQVVYLDQFSAEGG